VSPKVPPTTNNTKNVWSKKFENQKSKVDDKIKVNRRIEYDLGYKEIVL
jgi:hypothetical protein